MPFPANILSSFFIWAVWQYLDPHDPSAPETRLCGCLLQIAMWFAQWKGSSKMFKESRIACCVRAGLDLTTEKKKAVTVPFGPKPTHQRSTQRFANRLVLKIRRCLNISLNYIHCHHICPHRVMWHVFWLHLEKNAAKAMQHLPRAQCLQCFAVIVGTSFCKARCGQFQPEMVIDYLQHVQLPAFKNQNWQKQQLNIHSCLAAWVLHAQGPFKSQILSFVTVSLSLNQMDQRLM